MKTREVLSENLRTLMEATPALGTLKKITAASDGRLSNGKLDRIRRATHTTDIDALGELAAVFGLEPWQLLVENLKAEALPVLAGPELLQQIRTLVLGESPTHGYMKDPISPEDLPPGHAQNGSSTDEQLRRTMQRNRASGAPNESSSAKRAPGKRGDRRA